MSEEIKHDPTPWAWKEHGRFETKDGGHIFSAVGMFRQNAEFILKAVNSFASLTQELKDKTEALEKIAQVGNIRTERRKNEKS